MIGNYEIRRKNDLVFPYYLANKSEGRETLTREAAFSFPLATVGFAVGGPPGVLAGHIIGAVAGYIRHRRIHR